MSLLGKQYILARDNIDQEYAFTQKILTQSNKEEWLQNRLHTFLQSTLPVSKLHKRNYYIIPDAHSDTKCLLGYDRGQYIWNSFIRFDCF